MAMTKSVSMALSLTSEFKKRFLIDYTEGIKPETYSLSLKTYCLALMHAADICDNLALNYIDEAMSMRLCGDCIRTIARSMDEG